MKWVDADTALRRMGTRRQTLYANVSRGRIRARPDPSDSRKSLYAEDDVMRLAGRAKGRPSTETVAVQTIRWGQPVLTSAISTIVEGKLIYRGQDAAKLALNGSLEDTAALLWQLPGLQLFASNSDAQPGVAGAMQALAERAASDAPTLGRSQTMLRDEAHSVFGAVATCLAGPGEGPLADRLASHWNRPDASSLISMALVLLADHELNASTFAARITASTGAPLAACLLSGLCALAGPLHGGASAAVTMLSHHAREFGARQAVRRWLAQGQALPAFGHPLYPEGDIRALTLLNEFELTEPMSELRAAAEALTGELANVDFALCALQDRFELPEDAPLVLFTLGRSAGWLAHALEQIESGELIRPRARYIGPPITESDGD